LDGQPAYRGERHKPPRGGQRQRRGDKHRQHEQGDHDGDRGGAAPDQGGDGQAQHAERTDQQGAADHRA
jgi:hypothetical protein